MMFYDSSNLKKKRIFIPAIKKVLIKKDKFMLNLSDSLSLVGEQGAYGIISKNLVDEKFYISKEIRLF
jgi:uncharacterized protein YrrD